MDKTKKEPLGKYLKELFEILFIFMKIGLVSFGGGLAILRVYEDEFVTKRKWLTKEELFDYYILSQVTPGIIIVSTSSYIGYKLKKQSGLLAAVIGVLIPSITIICIVAFALSNLLEYKIVLSILKGMNIAVLAVLIDINIDLVKKNVTNIFYFIIFLLAFLAMKVFNVSILVIVLVSALLGLLIVDKKNKEDISALVKLEKESEVKHE